MIIDSFLYAGEEDLLRLRMATLGDVVDRFVALEARETIQGARRELSKLPSGVERIIVDSLPDGTPHQREDFQRDLALHIDASTHDVLFHGDVDEIPNPEAVDSVRDSHAYTVFTVRAYYWAIDWFMGDQYQTFSCRFGDANPSAMRPKGGHFPHGANADWRAGFRGWHFSWLGGPKVWAEKMRTFSHPEAAWMADDWDHWYRDGWHWNGVQEIELIPVEVDETYPKPIVDGTFEVPIIWRRPR